MTLLFTLLSLDLIKIPPIVPEYEPTALSVTLPLPLVVKPSVICVANSGAVGLLLPLFAETLNSIPPFSFVSNDAFWISKIGLLFLRLASSLKVNLPFSTDKFAAQSWWLDPVDSLCS